METKQMPKLPWMEGNVTEFLILTAMNPMVKKVSDEQNKQLMDSLLSLLEGDSINFLEQEGMYGGIYEKSVIILNQGSDYGQSLAKTFMQESYVYGEWRDGQWHYKLIGQDGDVFSESDNILFLKKRPADNWSQYKNIIYSIDF